MRRTIIGLCHMSLKHTFIFTQVKSNIRTGGEPKINAEMKTSKQTNKQIIKKWKLNETLTEVSVDVHT